MSHTDKSRIRRQAYNEYLLMLNSGTIVNKQDIMDKLISAFDINEEDIKGIAEDIAIDGPMDVRMAQFLLLMEDLKDYRDSLQIKANRSTILKESLQDDKIANEGYLFLG